MKTINLLTLVVISALGFSCQKSGTNAGSTGNREAIPCVNCQASHPMGQPLLESVQGQTWGQEIVFNLQVFGTPAPGCLQPQNKQIICAQGQGSLGGTMRVQNSNAVCGIPAGDYLIQSTQPSQIGNAMLFGGQYRAVGPGNVSVLIQLQSAILYNPSGLDFISRDNRIGITAAISRGDGASCGWIYTN